MYARVLGYKFLLIYEYIYIYFFFQRRYNVIFISYFHYTRVGFDAVHFNLRVQAVQGTSKTFL